MNSRHLLTKTEVFELVTQNQYTTPQNSWLKSRCFSGRYENKTTLPVLALPGGDLGELAVLYASANEFGFEVKPDKAFKTLIDLVGGAEHFSLESSHQCEYLSQLKKDPKGYRLTGETIEKLDSQAKLVQKKGAKPTIFSQTAREGALLFLKGKYGVLPQFELDLGNVTIATQVYIYHTTYLSQRRKEWVKVLLAEKAVKLFDGLDEEYLSHTLVEVGENHLFETLTKEGQGLPIYHIQFKDDGTFIVEDSDKI